MYLSRHIDVRSDLTRFYAMVCAMVGPHAQQPSRQSPSLAWGGPCDVIVRRHPNGGYRFDFTNTAYTHHGKGQKRFGRASRFDASCTRLCFAGFGARGSPLTESRPSATTRASHLTEGAGPGLSIAISVNAKRIFDVIVVGGGSAGAVLPAPRMTFSEGHKEGTEARRVKSSEAIGERRPARKETRRCLLRPHLNLSSVR